MIQTFTLKSNSRTFSCFVSWYSRLFIFVVVVRSKKGTAIDCLNQIENKISLNRPENVSIDRMQIWPSNNFFVWTGSQEKNNN